MNDGTFSNAKVSDSVLTLDVMRKMMERVKPIPRYDVLVGHPEKVSSWTKELFERGITIHKNEFLVDRIPIFKPRTKKTRVQKKALKRFGYKEVPSNKVYLLDTQKIYNDWFNKSMRMTFNNPQTG